MTDTPHEQPHDEAAADPAAERPERPEPAAEPAPPVEQPTAEQPTAELPQAVPPQETTPLHLQETEPLRLQETTSFPAPPAPPTSEPSPFAPRAANDVPQPEASSAAAPHPQQPYGQAPAQPFASPYGAPSPAHGSYGVPAVAPLGAHAAPTANPYGAPSGEQPGAAHHAAAPATPGYGLATGQPTATETAPPAGGAHARKRRGWVPVVSTAAITAIIVSLGSVALTGGFDRSATSTTSSSTTQIGQQGDSSVSVPVSASSAENPDWQKVSSAVAPSVVSIQVTLSQGEAEGSGVVLDAKGNILTNNHVVSGANTVQVTLSDGRIYSAKIVGTDPTTDLAVVRLDSPPDDLKSAVFADSDSVTVGDPVMAVGNPLGLSNTVTTGIVSALNRPVSTSTSESGQQSSSDAVVTNAIQIDAAINPGNSGGPLFNAQGEVIGITSSIATLSSTSDSSGSIGLGFAIPANLASTIGGQLITSGTAQHAYLGVTLTDTTAEADGTKRQGAKIESVLDSSPAADAGLKTGDVVTGIDGYSVSGAESLTAFVRAHASGDTVKLTVVRDGKALDVTVTLATRQDDTTSSGTGSGNGGGSGSDDGSGSGSGDQGFGGGSDDGSGSGQGQQGDGQGIFPWGNVPDGQG